MLRRDVSHVRSRIVKVDFQQNEIHHLIERQDTFASIKWYQISRLLGEILPVFIVRSHVFSYLQSTKKPKKIRVRSSYLKQSEPLHNLFSICFVEFAVASSCRVAGLSV